MKKIFSLLVFTLSLSFVFVSCSNDDNDDFVNTDTIAEVFEVTTNFSYDNQYGWIFKGLLNPKIFSSDQVLVYRLSSSNGGKDVWQPLPRTNYLNTDINGDGKEDEIDYDFDFSVQDFVIYASGNYNLSLDMSLLTKQTFRIVIVPGYFSKKITTPVDYNDYNAVIKYYHIDESKIKELKK